MPRLQFWRFDNGGIRDLLSASDHLARSHLEATLLDLVYLRVSQLNRCDDCVTAHADDAIRHGVARETVEELATWRETAMFTERQRAALAWTEAVTDVSNTGAPDDLYRKVSSQFSETELVDLTLAIALMNAFARIAVAFRSGPPPRPALSHATLP
jgi:AhpD family alkylhydroperoxidase